MKDRREASEEGPTPDSSKPPGRSKTALGCGLVLVALVVAPFFTAVRVQLFAIGVGAVESGPVRDNFIRNLWNSGSPGHRVLAGLFRSGSPELRRDICHRFDWRHPETGHMVVPAGFEPLLPELLEFFKTTDDHCAGRLTTLVKFVRPVDHAEAAMARLREHHATNLFLVHDLSRLPDSGAEVVIRRLAEARESRNRQRLIKDLVGTIHHRLRNDPYTRARAAIGEEWPAWSPELRADFVKACEELGARPAPLDSLIPSKGTKPGDAE